MTPPTWTVAGPSAVEPPPQQAGGGLPVSSKGAGNSQQDRKDLERFAKFFTLKCVQVIVQSRLGQKIKCASKPMSTGADWVRKTNAFLCLRTLV